MGLQLKLIGKMLIGRQTGDDTSQLFFGSGGGGGGLYCCTAGSGSLLVFIVSSFGPHPDLKDPHLCDTGVNNVMLLLEQFTPLALLIADSG